MAGVNDLASESVTVLPPTSTIGAGTSISIADGVASMLPAKQSKQSKRNAKPKKGEYDVLRDGVAYSKCPDCGKLTKGSKGTHGPLCKLALPSHDITFDDVPNGYAKVESIGIACDNAKPRIGRSKLVQAFGHDRVVQLPACPATYPLRILGTRGRYMLAFWKTVQGLAMLRKGDFSKIPTEITKLVPERVQSAWQAWHERLEKENAK